MTDSTKTIYHPRPKADSSNNQPVPKVLSITNNQWKGPISTNRASKKCKTNPITLPQIENRQSKVSNLYTLFLIFSSKVRNFLHILQLFDINTLNSMYNKDLHKYITCLRQFHPGSPILIHSFTHSPIHTFMQNKPNFKTSRIEYQESREENIKNKPNLIPLPMLDTTIEIRNTQYEIREKKICKTNPICKNQS